MTRYDAMVELCMVHHVYVERLSLTARDRTLPRDLRARLTADLQRRLRALQKAIDMMSAPRDKPL